MFGRHPSPSMLFNRIRSSPPPSSTLLVDEIASEDTVVMIPNPRMLSFLALPLLALDPKSVLPDGRQIAVASPDDERTRPLAPPQSVS